MALTARGEIELYTIVGATYGQDMAVMGDVPTGTLGRTDIASHLPFVRQPHKLPVVLSPEEVSTLIVTGQVAQPQRAEIARLKTPARLVELGRGLR